MKKSILSILILFSFLPLLNAQDFYTGDKTEEVEKKPLITFNDGGLFELDLLKDSIILGSGVALNGTWLVCDKIFKVNRKSYNNEILIIDDVNSFDRLFMKPYTHSLDIAGDICMAVTVFTPLLLYQTDSSDWLKLGIIYGETMLMVNGIKEIGKLCTTRPRPYSYYPGGPSKAYSNGDWCKSWPSGHTSFAFASATFTSYVFAKYYPDSNWKYAVIAGTYTLATTTAILRIESGNHFLTDVLTGAAIGTACGFLVPWLHTLNEKTNNVVTISPTGFNICLTF